MRYDPIGILGGTFDPVHHGHLRLALEARERLELSHVRLIPVGMPPHRLPPRADGRMRLRMLEAAVRGEAGLVADERELRQGGVSYTVETLEALRRRFSGGAFCLILGMDAFCCLDSWHRWERLLALAHIVVARRPGAALPAQGVVAHLLAERETEDPADLRQEPAGRIIGLCVPQLEISSTDVRARATCGASIRYLVPDPVLEIIAHEQLYV
uniref:Probable nicotinate-nucleotide adenylyltransferase n=1 Tax=Candidatus Kentrum sp. DK TaxID=2126562 RepID=A0A450TC08_9GAMM|nr:MAG: nicotinate-nucleotide adenylyltransferase [Candidatus Kentron sp. DK]VFJ64329.1 MAG: nicotinate-nucleotide adenylyltransferase [Candidatus Kentron sp. DK]